MLSGQPEADGSILWPSPQSAKVCEMHWRICGGTQEVFVYPLLSFVLLEAQGLCTTVIESNLSEFLLNLLKKDVGWTREHFPTLDGLQAIVQADTVQLATTAKIEMSNRPYPSSIPLAHFVALILFSLFHDRRAPPLPLYTITRDPIFLGIPLHLSSRSSAGTLLQP